MMALSADEVLQRILDEDSDSQEEDVGDFVDERGSAVILEQAVLSANLPCDDFDTPAARDSLLLFDKELVEQLDDDKFATDEELLNSGSESGMDVEQVDDIEMSSGDEEGTVGSGEESSNVGDGEESSNVGDGEEGSDFDSGEEDGDVDSGEESSNVADGLTVVKRIYGSG